MATLTTNYSFIKPGVNDPTDQDLWGGYLNENWDSVDSLLAPASSDIPVGCGADFWGSTAPSKWAFAYGQALNRTTYSALFTAIGTTYGVGDGSTTFNLPDKRGRASFGKDNMGGTSANRLTDQSGGIDGDTLGDTGGAETVALTSAQNGPHTHTYALTAQAGGSSASPAVPASTSADPTNTNNYTTSSSGSGSPHNNLPPGIVCNYIIYTGVA